MIESDSAAVKSIFLCMVSLVIFLVITWGPFPLAGASTETACRALVSNKCSSCHFVSYSCQGLDQRKGHVYWQGIVERMVKKGLVATEDEQQTLVQCLESSDSGLQTLCAQQPETPRRLPGSKR